MEIASSEQDFSRPINQNQLNQMQQVQIDGSNNNIRGRTPNNHRRHHNQNRGGRFNNRQQGNARLPVNFPHHHRHHGFVNGAPPNLVDPQRPLFPQFAPPNFPHQYFNFNHVPTSPLPPPHFVPPVVPPNHPQYPNFGMPMMYNGHSFHQDSAGFYGPPPPPMMDQLPLMNAMRGPALRPPPQAMPPVVQTLPNPLPSLSTRIQNQIDYYFSDANLAKDHYLKGQMDEQGWVSVHVIAEFNRVKNLTNDIGLILRALRSSLIVEVQGDKMRRKGNWMNYLVATTISEIQAGIDNIQLDSKSEVEEQKADPEG